MCYLGTECRLTGSLIRRILGGPPAVPIHDPRLGAALQGWRVQQTWRVAAVEMGGMGRMRNCEPMGRTSERRGSITHKSGVFWVGEAILPYKLAWKVAFSSWRLSCGKQSPPWQAVSVTHKHGGQEHAAELGPGFLITEANKLKVYLQDGKLIAWCYSERRPNPFYTFLCGIFWTTSIVMFLSEKQRGKE